MTYPVQTTCLVCIFKYKKIIEMTENVYAIIYLSEHNFFIMKSYFFDWVFFKPFNLVCCKREAINLRNVSLEFTSMVFLPQYHFLQPPWQHGSSFSNPISNRIEQGESKYKSIAFNSGWTYIKLCIRHRYIETD